MICDEFIARIHFIIFRQNCPILSVAAKKMISKVGHWYLEEKNTYIRVFGAIGAPHLLPSCVPGPFSVGGNMLPDHFTRFQCLSGEGQEEGFYTLLVSILDII
jgi:hypothetical protein